jgi:hypothetical protein
LRRRSRKAPKRNQGNRQAKQQARRRHAEPGEPRDAKT